MAAILPSSLSTSQWTTGTVVLGAYQGFYCNRLWEHLINYNNANPRNPLSHWGALGISSLSVWTFINATRVLYPLSDTSGIAGFFARHHRAFAYGIGALMTLNIVTLFRGLTTKNARDAQSEIDKFLVVVWKITPYLMMITHIALVIIDICNNNLVGLVSLAATGITLLDLTAWKPESFSWYLDVGIRVPFDIAVMYYDNEMCFPILLMWSLDTRVRHTFYNCYQKLASSI